MDYITESNDSSDEVMKFSIRYQINGNLVTSDVGREWLDIDAPTYIAFNESMTGTTGGNSVNTWNAEYPEFSNNITFQKPIKCHSIALQIHTRSGSSGVRQYFKILNISMKYRIIGKTQDTETGGVDSYSVVP
jgi:hypothetical protein